MSQADLILRLLETGPKTCAEILREVPCIVHSRISDLRARGHQIDHVTTGPGAAGSLYTLTPLRETPRAEHQGLDGSASLGEGSQHREEVSPANRLGQTACPFAPPSTPIQLSLEAA